MAEEDRLRAEAGLVELRNPNGVPFYKRLADLTPEDRTARAQAEGARAAWLKKRHEWRVEALARMGGGERLRFEEERGRFLAAELLEEARAQERWSIGRELHDRVAHTLGVVHHNLQLYEALKASDPNRAQSKLELARRMVLEAMEETKDLSVSLRQAEAEAGLEPALSELLGQTLSAESNHELEVQGDESILPSRIRDQMFLILREAVRNAIAHSGMHKIRVVLRVAEQEATGIVEDDGRGFDPEEGRGDDSGGLSYMAERVALVGGRLRVRSALDEGTRVEVVVPLRRRG